MWLLCFPVSYMPKMRGILVFFCAPLSLSLSSFLNPLRPFAFPTTKSHSNHFINVRPHHILPKFQGDLQKGHHYSLQGQRQEGQHVCRRSTPPPACGPDSRLELCGVDGVSFPHHPAHRTVPGTQEGLRNSPRTRHLELQQFLTRLLLVFSNYGKDSRNKTKGQRV